MALGLNAIANLLGTVNANGALLVTLDGGEASATTFLAGDGTAAAPSYSFTSAPNTGWFMPADNHIGYSADGTEYFRFQGDRLLLTSAGTIAWTNGAIGGTADTVLSRGAANLLQVASGDSVKLVLGVLYGGGVLSRLATVTTISTAGAVTYSAAEVAGGLILRDCNGAARADLVPTAANLLAAIPSAQVGQSFEFTIRNTSGTAVSITVTTNTGVTLSGTMTVAQNNTKRFMAVFTNVTAASEAYTLYSLGTVVH